MKTKSDILTDDPIEHATGGIEHVVEVCFNDLDGLLPAEGKELPREFSGFLRRTNDAVERRSGIADALFDAGGVTADDSE